MAEKIGVYHMIDSANPSLYEISRSNNFELIVTGIDSLLKAGAKVDEDTAEDGDYTSGGEEAVRLSVIKTTVPHFTQEEIEIKRGNMKMYAAGVPTYTEGTLEVNDFIGLNGKSVLQAWQRLSFDATSEKVGRMVDYKKSCTLIEYSPDYQLIRKWRLDGCWVKGLTEPEFSMEDGAKRTITATIRYDRALPIYDE